MVVTVATLVGLAKTYANDDHVQNQGSIADSTWLMWANMEWRFVYQLLLDYSLISVPTASLVATPVAGQIALTDCLGILHVSAADGDSRRLLTPAQPEEGRYPFRSYVGTSGPASEWWAEGSGGAVTVTVNPPDSSSTYEVRYVPEPPELVLTAPGAGQVDNLNINPLAVDIMALRMANKAMIRLNGYSGNLIKTMKETMEELNMQSVARHPGAHTVKNSDAEVRGWIPSRKIHYV